MSENKTPEHPLDEQADDLTPEDYPTNFTERKALRSEINAMRAEACAARGGGPR